MAVFVREFRQLFGLALPLVFTQVAQMGMGVADTLMAGQISSVELAGVALGGAVLWPLLLLVAGVVMSLTPVVSQLHGAGRSAEAGEVTRQALWIAVLAGVALTFVLRNLAPLYMALGVDPEVIVVTSAYLQAISWGVIPVLGYFAMRYLCEGLSWTTPSMLIAGSALLLKVPLNYWFMYGGLGLPAMGGEGCGWASALVMVYELVAISLVVTYSRIAHVKLFAEFSWPQWAQIQKLARLGIPIGMATFAEFGFFSVVTLMIGRLGAETVAAHQIVNNISGLIFMIPLGLGMATAIRVGYNVGRQDHVAARRSGWVAIGTSFSFALFAITVLLLFGEILIGLYSSEVGVILLATQLLVIVAIYQIFDDIQVIAMGALRGYKDTAMPFLLAFCCYWLIGFPIAWTLGYGYVEALDFGVFGYWMGLASGLVAASIILVYRFHRISARFVAQHES
ncbi:MAG: MATE family efflux transporter [OM182 bacterium]|nr:MAG: MATE family efflux transporter [OM182 bacterium]|tara:strand:+ start:3595 stop:4950 length:1356 start_codon:yes stop_codon:yes gene_type:complete